MENKEIICNFCGYSCNTCLDNVYIDNSGLINAKVVGGYSSTPGNGYGTLDDMTKYQFSLCEFCLDYMFCNFAIPPKVNTVDFELNETSKDEHFVPAIERLNSLSFVSDFEKFNEHFSKESEKRKVGRERRAKLKLIT